MPSPEDVLDTNICIYALRRRPPEVLSRLERLTPADVAVSAVTAAELRFGASKSSAPERNHRVLDVFLGHINVLAFDVDAATSYGRVRAHLERASELTLSVLGAGASGGVRSPRRRLDSTASEQGAGG